MNEANENKILTFIGKDALKPILNSILPSAIFAAGYEISTGVCISFAPAIITEVPHLNITLSIHLVEYGYSEVENTFEREISEEDKQKIKDTIFEAYKDLMVDAVGEGTVYLTESKKFIEADYYALTCNAADSKNVVVADRTINGETATNEHYLVSVVKEKRILNS